MASEEEAETRGWQVGKSLAGCLGHMLDNHVACDVTFEVQFTGQPNVKIPAHKLMLQARSPVFEAMFSGSFVEADGNVVITDMEPDPFKELLRYMYTDEIALTGDNILSLCYAAKKYFLENLANKCRKFLGENISVDNACLIFTHNLIQQDETLVNTCLDFIAHNIKAVLETEAFYKMSHDALLKVVRCDQLAHGVEAALFEACIEWGKRRVHDPDNATDEEVRDILGMECLHNIRFPYMSYIDFANKFYYTNVLNNTEKGLVYTVLNRQEDYHSKALSELGFDVGSRMIRARRYRREVQEPHNKQFGNDHSEEFTFSVNKPIQLRGFTIHGGIKDSEHDVKITIHNTTEKGDPCVQTEQKIRAIESYKPIPVYFGKTPISVNTEYRVCARIEGTEKTSYSLKPIMKVEEDNLTISTTFIKFPLKWNDEHLVGFVAEFLYQRLPSP